MNNEQAYPEMPSYERRVLQRFENGDRVTVGPAYQMGGSYACDGSEGTYFVVGVIGGGSFDYKLARELDGDWCLIAHPSRLQAARS